MDDATADHAAQLAAMAIMAEMTICLIRKGTLQKMDGLEMVAGTLRLLGQSDPDMQRELRRLGKRILMIDLD